MRRYPHAVTFQAPTEARTASGAVTLSYEDVEALTELPALVIGGVTESQGDRMSLERDLYQIIVEGDREVVPDMAALTDHVPGVLDVIRVVRPVAPMPMATIVTVERVAL
jgi:hypothetical protein